MSKLATSNFIILIVLISLTTINSTKMFSKSLVRSILQEPEVCPGIEYRPASFTDNLMKLMKSLTHEKRVFALEEELKTDTLLINSQDIVRLVTQVVFRKELGEVLKVLNNYILRITPEELVTIVKAQKKKFQADAVEQFKSSLSEVSVASKEEIIEAVSCPKLKVLARKSLEGIKPRSCVFGKLSQNVVFLIDLSGSMNFVFTLKGKKYTRLNFLKPVIVKAIESFSSNNYFKIVTFATGSRVWKDEFVSATPENKDAAIQFVLNLRATGYTNTKAGLVNAFNVDKKSFSMMFFTDGLPTKEETNIDKILKYIRNNNQNRVNNGQKAVKIHMNVVMLGGDEKADEKKKTENFFRSIALSTSGTFKNFSG